LRHINRDAAQGRIDFCLSGSHDRSALSGDSMINLGSRGKRMWRPFIGLLVAYAVAAQGLLIAVGGFASLAHADQNGPAFELCLHDAQAAAQAAPNLPTENPGQGHAGCTHCIFCFAGAHHALIGSAPALFHRVGVTITAVAWAADKHCLPRLSAYSIASPRGPPLRA
jgi:hypothetical protein